MAKPIKETPVLRGRDAETFIRTIEKNQTAKISQTESVRIQQNFEKINALFQK